MKGLPRLAALAALRRHPIAAVWLIAIAGGTLMIGYVAEQLPKAAVYLFAMLACVVTTDLVATAIERWRGKTQRTFDETFPVKQPRQETILVVGTSIVGLAAFFVSRAIEPTELWLSLIVLIAKLLAIALMWPVIPAIYLLIRGYPPATVGFARPSPVAMLLVAVPVQAIVAGASLLIAPEAAASLQLGSMLRLTTVAVMAALPEELFRLLAQTRVGALVRNQATGWLVAAGLWAVMHVPSAFANQPAEVTGVTRMLRPLLGSVTLVPMGLMWSYVAWRTRSLWPSMLVHATNYWRLQSF